MRCACMSAVSIDALAEQRGPFLRWSSSRPPVSIFMVVVLPQPFEPRKPKISPRSMRKLTWSTATKSPKRRVSPSATIAGGPSSSERAGRLRSVPRRRAVAGGQQRDIRLLEIPPARARALQHGRQCARSRGRGRCPWPPDARSARPPPCRPSRRARSCPWCPARRSSRRASENWRRDSGSTRAGRLVENQQVGVVHEGAAQTELLFHAAGELAGRAQPRKARRRLRSSSPRDARAAGTGFHRPKRRPKKSMFS